MAARQKIVIYGIKTCDTMTKARKWLDGHRVAYAFHDYRVEGLDKARLKTWVDALGWEKLLNKSSATFQYTVKKGTEQVLQLNETSAEMKQTGDQITIERLLPLSTLTPGKYTLEIHATDTLSNQSISRTADFTVKAPTETKSAANVAPGGSTK